MTNVIAKEVAEAEFERFLEAMYLRFDVEDMDAEDKTAFKLAKAIVLRAMMDGRLTVNEKGEPIFAPFCGGDPLTFREAKGSTFMVTDQHKKNQDVHKSYAMLAEITGNPAVRFSNMPNRDLKVCEKIAMLFLTSS